MAELVVGAVVGGLVEKLGSLAYREFARVWGVEEDVDKLSSILSTIQAVLEDAENRQVADKSIADWLSKLKAAAYEADDILDEWLIEAHQVGISAPFSIFIFRRKIAKKIKEIITKFNRISEERSNFHLNSVVVVQHQTGSQLDATRETSSLLTEEAVYGRDGDRENIIHRLLSWSEEPDSASGATSEENLSILSILGIGGLGKTTLAKLVYNDQRVVEHFKTRIWVCVSEIFEVKRLTGMILESLIGTRCNLDSLDPMQRLLQEQLRGKKFLLVLDDVWNEDLEKWLQLKSSLTCGIRGSSIIVTTRLETVATMASTVPPHSLSFLLEEDCWSLFRARAFGGVNDETAELVVIGKAIVKKCGGVPLALKALGGLLFYKKGVNEWVQVRDNEIWQLKGNDVLPSLRISYNHLPSHLKQCFAFCAVYPKDYEMNIEELIQLWIANGFVKSDARMELEDSGNLIFNELFRRSFFQDRHKDESNKLKSFWGNIHKDEVYNYETCKMHDLMHDLASSMDECSVLEVSKASTFSLPFRIKHMSLVFGSETRAESNKLRSLFTSNPMLRTQLFLSSGSSRWGSCLPSIVFHKKFGCLRALDVSKTGIEVLSSSIGKMKLLRYLNLSDTRIRFLPASICDLRNLQSLKLRKCLHLEKLPRNTSKMRNLRHLDIAGCYRLKEMPIGMGKLTHLQTLGTFVVGPRNGQKIKELQKLKELRGGLYIKGLEHVRSSGEVKEASLLTRQSIFSLGLHWSRRDNSLDGELHESVLKEGLQPHPGLKVFSIHGYKGAMFPSWMALLHNLVEITLQDCDSCKCLPPLGQFSHLKVLEIGGMSSVKCIGDDFYGDGGSHVQGFPSLELLKLDRMDGLEEWNLLSMSEENPRQVFPCLNYLMIEDCPKLKGVPFLPCVQYLRLSNSNEMILRNWGNLSPLRMLFIFDFEEMVSIPEVILKNCTALQTLRIASCYKLKHIGGEIENLKALTSFEIGFSNELVSLLDGLLKLTSLETLRIMYCPELVILDEDFKHLVSLQHLQLIGLPKMRALPEGIQHLTKLQYLEIEDCKNLKMLPEWMSRLTSLQSLEIVRCPGLLRRCKQNKGEDWHKISHIPSIEIGIWRRQEGCIPRWLKPSADFGCSLPSWILNSASKCHLFHCV